MKYSFLILFLLLIVNSSCAQKLKRHEFGIGAGYLEYSNHSDGPLTKEWKPQFAFTSFDEGNFYFIKELYKTNFTVPALYYSYSIGKRVQARVSYQLSLANGEMNPIRIDPPYYTSVTSTMRCHVIEAGYFYTFIDRKRFSIATGLGFNAYTVTSKTTYQFESGNKQTIRDSKGQSGIFSSFRATVPLSEIINLKYDISLLTDMSAFFYRPLNRLSINLILHKLTSKKLHVQAPIDQIDHD